LHDLDLDLPPVLDGDFLVLGEAAFGLGDDAFDEAAFGLGEAAFGLGEARGTVLVKE
jgi:hypothetical protein